MLCDGQVLSDHVTPRDDHDGGSAVGNAELRNNVSEYDDDNARALETERSHDSLLSLLGRMLDLLEQACREGEDDDYPPGPYGDLIETDIGDFYENAVGLAADHFDADLSWRTEGGYGIDDVRGYLTSVRVALGWACYWTTGSCELTAASTSLCREFLIASTACVVNSPLLVFRGAVFLLDRQWDSHCAGRAGLDLVIAVSVGLQGIGDLAGEATIIACAGNFFAISVMNDPATATRYDPDAGR